MCGLVRREREEERHEKEGGICISMALDYPKCEEGRAQHHLYPCCILLYKELYQYGPAISVAWQR